MPEFLEVVCAVILDDNGRFLACRRAEGRHLAGKWEFPGGKVNEEERPEAALVREIHEELGVRIRVGEPLTPVEFSYGETAIRLHPWMCEIIAGNLRPVDHSETRWCATEEDWRPLDWAEADVPILWELRKLSKNS